MPGWSKLLDDKQITDIYTYIMARTARVLPVGRPDEVGAKGGPWIPPEGWPEEQTEIFASTVPREVPEMSDDPASSTAPSEDPSSPKTNLAGTPEEISETANPLMDAFRSSYQTVRLNLMATAEAMPEEHYDYRLRPDTAGFRGVDPRGSLIELQGLRSHAAGRSAGARGAGWSHRQEAIDKGTARIV